MKNLKVKIAEYIQDEISDLSCPRYKAEEMAQHIVKETAKEIFNNLSNDKFIRDNNFGFL